MRRSIIACLAVTGLTAAAQAAPKPTEYRTLAYTGQQWQNSTYWTGADWARVGRDWQHPGTGAPSVRRFVVPADGKVTISGPVRKLDLGGGDGVLAIILLDEAEVWSAEIRAQDATGKDPGLALNVRQGQSLRFVVQPRATIFHDSTGWDPVVRYADGRQYQASSAFGNEQGRGGWHYEMGLLPGALDAAAGQPPPHASPDALRALAGQDLPAMAEAEWRMEDRLDGERVDWPKLLERHLDGTRKLLEDLRASAPGVFLREEAQELARLAEAAREARKGTETLYLEIRRLKRRVALANPLLHFERLLFCKRRPTSYSHEVMQYFGWRAQRGGGLFVLEKPGHSLQARDILDGKLAAGSILGPNLSCDGRQIVFSWVALAEGHRPAVDQPEAADEAYFHLYVVNVDGTGLRQITSGPFDDLMPTWLPDGGIAFSSTRRRGYSRCFGAQFGQRWHVYTLHRVQADGSQLRTLSHHDTNEWFPSVMSDGRIAYARWDYIDRDAVTHQNLWATRPDGSNPIALWGNGTPNPHCAFEARAVPGSDKMVFTASAHHSITAGSIVLVDPSIDNNSHAAIERVTPAVPFPESEGRPHEYYCAPWPLSERYFLVAYSPLALVFEPGANADNALGLYLLDTFGNRELIYRDAQISSTSPMPLRATPRPPLFPGAVPADARPSGTVVMSDVYRGLGPVARGTIKELRVVQIFPKTTPVANAPRIGMAGEENARAILGTVPVEADGSAYFELPAGKPVLFQALDKDGFAYQTMRTLTYVQPGESVSCVGCHESRMGGPPTRSRTLATGRAPSQIERGPLGGAPFSYPRLVQPVLDRHCGKCHGANPGPGKGIRLTPATSYGALAAYVPRFAARNQVQVTEPGGKIGAIGSRLMGLLRAGHGKVNLPDEDRRALAAWIDLNAVFFGSYDGADNEKELRGEPIAMPRIQ